MWGRALVVLFVAGCGSHGDARTARSPQTSSSTRCTLRISQQRILVDGEPRSRADAIAYCTRTPGGAVVVIDEAPTSEWDATRLALQHEGVRFFVRGPLCYGPHRDDCRPRTPRAPPTLEAPPRLELQETPVAEPAAPPAGSR